ncbi:DNA-3-methyladenine glycosylase [Kribbella soli]|uniref:Putative 3-methyladenine DNA glycosylase n=1 Tax=Kribbella soli TaxID=1124743 RepID=A0A4V2LZX2_9ACTN|nr:DNA-3-methyladenine glycosylase [Kribbella soli]TCC09776.1 DNA-3-methyladenine glycosylase [Kribbella soli]
MRRSLLAGPVLEVAPRLLGMVLRSTTSEGSVAVRLTEVEAYDGPTDPGSHAYRGQTARNAVMFGPAGFLYVYFTYGMHFCMNVVAGPKGQPSAVLLRAGEVIEGIELARLRRNQPASKKSDRDLARGPARLCVALGIEREGNGTDLLAKNSPIELLDGPGFDGEPATGPRVGLREAADRPWRFWIPDDPTVSPYRPHVPKKRA